MNLHKRFTLSLGLVALLGITAVGASAETVMKGTFSLPVEAYWGNTRLPAGGYTLALNKEVTGINTVVVRGDGVAATFIAPAGPEEISTRSCLKVDEINGAYVIRELDAGSLGKSYKFGVTKAVRNMTLRGSAGQPVAVPVSDNGGL